MFITQDEIDSFLAGGGPYSDGRLSTYSFYLLNEDDKARTDFIKENTVQVVVATLYVVQIIPMQIMTEKG